MRETDNHKESKMWVAKDFERYYKNNMPPTERQALEKAALDDPFLQDALDGYAFTHTPVEDVKALRKRLKPAEDTLAPVAWYRRPAMAGFLRVAAILIVVAGFGWLWISKNQSNFDREKKEQLASSGPAREETRQQPALADSVQAADVAIGESAGLAEESKQLSINSNKGEDPAVSNARTGAIKTAPLNQGNNVLKPQDGRKPELLARTQPQLTELAKKPGNNDEVETVRFFSGAVKDTQAAARLEDVAISDKVSRARVLRGRVTDETGMPVPFARVKENLHNATISTDSEGYFSLPVDDEAEDVVVKVDALGYESKNSNLAQNSTANNIVLKETDNYAVASASLNKAKAGITNEPRQQTSTISVATPVIPMTNALPVDGWVKYNEAVKKLIPKQPIGDSAVTVRLTFRVDSAGKPINIKVIQPAGKAAEAAAVKILQNAPALKAPDKNKISTAQITLR